MEGLIERIEKLLADIQESMYQKALAFRDAHITRADTWDEFARLLDTKGGFISAHWDGTAETEEVDQGTIKSNHPLYSAE